MMRDLVIELSIMVAIGVMLAALGPFGSYALGDFSARLLYWLPAALIGYAVYRPATWIIELMARRLQLPAALGFAMTVVLAGVPATILMALLGGYSLSTLPPAGQLAPLYLNVVILGAVVLGLFILIERRQAGPSRAAPTQSAPAPEPEPAAAPPPRFPFDERLSPGFAHPLVALEMEDHYVRAHDSDGGSELILLRMADAERELAGADGARVHRSWWVMRSAVVGRRRSGRNLALQLKGGLEAPVARDRVADLRSRGWL